MAYTDINTEDRLVQATFAEHLEKVLGWENVYAWNQETFGPGGTLGRTDTRDVVLTRDLRAAVTRLNPEFPPAAVEQAVAALTRVDFSRSLVQHNQERYTFIRDSRIDLAKLQEEFAKKARRKATVVEDIRQIVERKLAEMLAQNPQRMDFYKRYSEIVADYNGENDRVTIEETFARLVDLANSLDAEQRRAAEEGLSEEELAVFDLLKKPEMSSADRERVKQASRGLLASIRALIAPLERWTEKEQTQAEVEVFILDQLFGALPTPPFTPDDKQALAKRVYLHVWQQSANPASMLEAQR